VLGPLLFVLYVNDLPDIVTTSHVYLFADDLKVYHAIENANDQVELQDDIKKVQQWANHSLLQLHPEKCVTMTVRNRGEPKPPPVYSLEEGQQLEQVHQTKDLGILVDEQLKFQEHLAAKVNQANKLLGLIWRTFDYKDKENLLLLYKSLIRPHLEYASQAWAPHLRKDIEALESVQRRATRMMPGLKELSYEERLKNLKLPTLAFRRLRGKMIEIYKMTQGHYEDQTIWTRIKRTPHAGTRGHSHKLQAKGARVDARKHSFFVRAVEPWNSLSSHVVEAPSIVAFERRLDKHWKDHPLKTDYRSTVRAHTATAALSQ
jgi:hypothetical protein